MVFPRISDCTVDLLVCVADPAQHASAAAIPTDRLALVGVAYWSERHFIQGSALAMAQPGGDYNNRLCLESRSRLQPEPCRAKCYAEWAGRPVGCQQKGGSFCPG